jgi:hypothetical protein
LKLGDKLDVLKEEKIHGESIKGWAVATIKDIDNNMLECSYDGMNKEELEYFEMSGPRIAPLSSRTDDWEWRNKIKEGDNIDVCDTQIKWYLSTVLKTNVDNKGMFLLFIGFRVYLPNGTKKDSEGKSFEGWSYQYDTWIPAHSIRIQK